MTNARDYDNLCVFLSSYRNTIFNQSTRVFSLGYFLNIIFFKDRAVFSLNATGSFADGIIRLV